MVKCLKFNHTTMQSEGLFMRSNSQEVEVVKKDNRLIEAKYKLSIHEQRLLFILLGNITIEDEDFQSYEINISKLAEQFGMEKSKSLYFEMQEAADTLLTKRIKLIDTDEDSDTVTWLSRSKYKKGAGKINVEFHPALKPYLLQLKSHFTQYQISAVAQFKSSYSIRFYELLKMFEYKGKGGQFYREFTIRELRDYMQIDKGIYENFKDLRIRVIEPSVKEINSFSDIKIVQVDYIKSGRAVAEIRITAEPKNQMVMSFEEPKEAEKNDEHPEAVKALLSFGIAENTAIKWTKKYGKVRVLRNVAYTLAMQKEGKVNNPQMYLSKAMEDDYGSQWQAESVKAQDEQKKRIKAEKTQEQEDESRRNQSREETEVAIRIFEGLSDGEQDIILDSIAAKLDKYSLAIFEKARKNNDAPHKNPMVAIFLKQVLKKHNV